MTKNSAIIQLCKKARLAAQSLARLTTAEKNTALLAMALGLRKDQGKILKANAKDLKSFEKKYPKKSALKDRLLLNAERLEKMAEGLEKIAQLPDPAGKIIHEWNTENGLKIRKVQIPLGVIGFIYEARPNVTSDAAGLCLKSGNAVILRGGSEAFNSNKAIVECLRNSLKNTAVSPDALQSFATTDRKAIDQMLKMEGLIDLVIPRGGEDLMKRVGKLARMPVLKHDKGVCHLYVDEGADPEMAIRIAVNAKVQRPGVCNAIETLLVHKSFETTLLPRLIKTLQENGVEVRASKKLAAKNPGVKIAKSSDYGKEFLELIIAVAEVNSLDEALAHITKYGSNHTESIVTENPANAERFLAALHSSVVLVNASTRFADGGEMGMGAEIGISTTKLHAYGPMGLDDLTIGHYTIYGDGQIRL